MSYASKCFNTLNDTQQKVQPKQDNIIPIQVYNNKIRITPFPLWKTYYQSYLRQLSTFYASHITLLYPSIDTDCLQTEDFFNNFCRFIFETSSRVII